MTNGNIQHQLYEVIIDQHEQLRPASKICTQEAILYSVDRANEVNKGFILWLCWIAICCDFVEKTKKRFRCSKTFSRIYLGRLFVQDSKTHSGSDFRRHYTA